MIFKEAFVKVGFFTYLDPEAIDDILIFPVENNLTIYDFDRFCPFS
jgi:hypothetical protein